MSEYVKELQMHIRDREHKIEKLKSDYDALKKENEDLIFEALKWIKELWCIEGCGCKACETLRELGVE